MAATAAGTLLLAVATNPAAQAAPQRLDTALTGVGIQLMEGPSNRADDPRAHRYVVDHLAPGTTIRRTVRVANNSTERQQIEVYPASAALGNQRFVFHSGRTTNELTSWIALDKGQLDLAAGEEAMIRATVTVPPTASSGERYGVIWASMGSMSKAAAGVTVAHRVGVRIYLDIGAGGEPASDFTISEVTPSRSKAGDPSLTVTVKNTGGRALDMSGTADLSDGPAGQRAGPFSVSDSTTLAPDESGTVSVQFPREIQNGPWKVILNLRSGMISHSVTAQITFPDPGETGRPGTIMTWLRSPWTLAGGIALIAIAVLIGFVYLARRRSRKTEPVA